MKVSTNWLRDFVTLAPPITRIADRLTLAGLEVKKVDQIDDLQDTVFEIEITSNRPDWLSHVGVAREISAVEALSLKMPLLDIEAGRTPPAGWKIHIKDAEACPYYTGVLIEGITETRTPEFMVQRLLACGVRSVNLIVDITNYVLLEYGQPLHAFDADLIQGREIQVRKAKPGERLLAINDATIELNPNDLVIADSDYAIALAGVMGGKKTEISDRTRNVFLESAFFDPGRVRRASRNHQLSTDSSYRFERRVDPETVDHGRQRALSLIKQYAKPGRISSPVKAGEKPILRVKQVHIREEEIRDVLGCDIKPNQVASILTKLGCEVKQHAPGSWKVGIPSFRADLERPVDLVEEIARIYGYDAIPETLPARAPVSLTENPRLKLERRLRNLLSGVGLHEAVTFSLISDRGLDEKVDLASAVRIVNPLHHGLHWMRPTLVTGLLDAVQKNVNAGADSVPLFEIANVYSAGEAQKHPREERMLGIMLYGKRAAPNWIDHSREASLFDVKGIVETILGGASEGGWKLQKIHKSYLTPSTAREFVVGAERLAFLGAVSPEVCARWDLKGSAYYAEISLDKVAGKAGNVVKKFREWPRYPAVARDLSLTVKDEVPCEALIKEICELGGGLIRSVSLFDLFRGKRIPAGYKNLAFRMVYQSLERTLVSEEVQKLHDRIADTLVRKYQAAFQQ